MGSIQFHAFVPFVRHKFPFLHYCIFAKTSIQSHLHNVQLATVVI